jgi:hypothetical protein
MAIYTLVTYDTQVAYLGRFASGCSPQAPPSLDSDHWSEVIGDAVIADAIRDRLEHSALAIHISGESYRGVKARKLASKRKDS